MPFHNPGNRVTRHKLGERTQFSRRPFLDARNLKLLLTLLPPVLGGIAVVAQTLPPSTAVPIVFTRTVKAGHAHAGDIVYARTIQMVRLPSGEFLPAGTPVLGHVLRSTSFVFDTTPYAAQAPSVLSIHFDSIAINSHEVPAQFEVRAIAGSIASHEAEIPQFRDEIDLIGTRVLIGGSSFSPLEAPVLAPDGDIVGYHRAHGVFARLLAADSIDGNSKCQPSGGEQSVAIFSPDACGVYGLNTVSMIRNGSSGDGAAVLESRRQSVEIPSRSTALLQVVPR